MIVVLRLQDWKRFNSEVTPIPGGPSYRFEIKIGQMANWLPVYETLVEASKVYPEGPFMEVRLTDVTTSFEIIQPMTQLEQEAAAERAAEDHEELQGIAGDLRDLMSRPSTDDDEALMEESAQELAKELGWEDLQDSDDDPPA